MTVLIKNNDSYLEKVEFSERVSDVEMYHSVFCDWRRRLKLLLHEKIALLTLNERRCTNCHKISFDVD